MSQSPILLYFYEHIYPLNSEKLRKVRLAIRNNNGYKRRAAKELEIAPKTLYAWMKDLGIPLDYK